MMTVIMEFLIWSVHIISVINSIKIIIDNPLQEDIQINFEASSISEEDYHGVKRLLQQVCVKNCILN